MAGIFLMTWMWLKWREIYIFSHNLFLSPFNFLIILCISTLCLIVLQLFLGTGPMEEKVTWSYILFCQNILFPAIQNTKICITFILFYASYVCPAGENLEGFLWQYYPTSWKYLTPPKLQLGKFGVPNNPSNTNCHIFSMAKLSTAGCDHKENTVIFGANTIISGILQQCLRHGSFWKTVTL